jgi:hypothetical protein
MFFAPKSQILSGPTIVKNAKSHFLDFLAKFKQNYYFLNGIKFEKDKTDRIMKCFFPPKVQF